MLVRIKSKYSVTVDGKRARLLVTPHASRVIFALGDVVVKVAQGSFDREQNRNEARRFRKYENTGLVPRVLAVSREGDWLVVERIRGLKDGDAERWPKAWEAVERLSRKMRLKDVDPDRNWGYVPRTKRVVLYDAGV